MSEWIPVTTRDLSLDEIKELVKGTSFAPDEVDPWCYSCTLPGESQDVLITTKFGNVALTSFCADEYGYYFEDYEDREDVLAWMPLPKPYQKDNEDN